MGRMTIYTAGNVAMFFDVTRDTFHFFMPGTTLGIGFCYLRVADGTKPGRNCIAVTDIQWFMGLMAYQTIS
jgi:hypothetical protein